MTNPLNIIFMGTPAFALPALAALLASEHKVIAVYTAPPKPAGRGKGIKKTPVHELAESNDIPVYTPASLKEEQLPAADVAVVAAYGILLPEHILNAPKYGCINIHPSLLPRWRGAAPLQRTIMAGDKETAVCIMQMDKGLDTGAVLMQENFAIEPKTTAGMLHDKCAAIGAELTLKVLENIASLKPVTQSIEGVTYAKKITREEELIDWNDSAENIANKIYGLNPFPSAHFIFAGQKIKVFECDVIPSLRAEGEAIQDFCASDPGLPRLTPRNDGTTPGQTIDDKLLIACGNGSIRITKLQKEGKRPMSAAEFLNGMKIAKGTSLA